MEPISSTNSREAFARYSYLQPRSIHEQHLASLVAVHQPPESGLTNYGFAGKSAKTKQKKHACRLMLGSMNNHENRIQLHLSQGGLGGVGHLRECDALASAFQRDASYHFIRIQVEIAHHSLFHLSTYCHEVEASFII